MLRHFFFLLSLLPSCTNSAFIPPNAYKYIKSQTTEPSKTDTITAQLRLAPTNLDRLSLLPKSKDWTFKFDEQDNYTWLPGSVVNANAASFPPLTGVGMTMAMLSLGPCAMLPPHMHPRANNLVVAIAGNTTSWMVNENGAPTVEVQLTPLTMTVFPRGSLHAMQNNGCDNALLVSALDSEDTGTLNFLNGLYNLPPEMVTAGFGNNFDFDVRDIGRKIPKVGSGAVMGSAECAAKCGITID
ncbi:RmlC-like cupin [Sporormia fimetaria CBS 119925]|uniref:RmlC-like cupin n=1 Tax=Sporormia fimetaria CBS 119925 TaxID=1340428 RepID=A0A6A6UYA6_9PLEO|nr:RmlC-like cupin [Sporormia fimetaria CBS 119925]